MNTRPGLGPIWMGVLSALALSDANAMSLLWQPPGYWQPPAPWSAPPNNPGKPEPLMVVDADGKTIGRFQTGLGGEVFAYTTINGRMAAIWLSSASVNSEGQFTDYIGLSDQNVQFVSSDCTGQPYLHEGYGRGIGALRTATLKVGDQWQLYVADSMESQQVPLRSYLYQGVCKQISPNINYPNPVYTAFPAQPPIPFEFTPPFRVR